jgi:hypothetical protein
MNTGSLVLLKNLQTTKEQTHEEKMNIGGYSSLSNQRTKVRGNKLII